MVVPTSEEFQEAWPRIVRVLAAWTGSLDDAEEYAAEAVSRAVTHHDVDDLAAWCVSVAKRAWIDDHRRRDVFARRMPELAPDEWTAAMDDDDLPEGLDTRLGSGGRGRSERRNARGQQQAGGQQGGDAGHGHDPCRME